MWRVAAVLAVGIMVIVIEAPSLIKTKKRRELWAFSGLLLSGTALCIAVIIGIDVPSPLEWIKRIYEPISRTILGK